MGIRLYELLPAIIRYQNELIQVDEESLLEKIVSILELETDYFLDKTKGIKNLIDPDNCDEELLYYLSVYLGTPIGSEFSEDFRRWFIKNLVFLYKIKGTHYSWDKNFEWLNLDKWKAEELYKTEINEHRNWYRSLDYNLLKSAKFDFYKTVSGEKEYLSPTDGRELLPIVEKFRPIHVVLRAYVEGFDLEDLFPAPVSVAVGLVKGEVSDSVGGLFEGALEITQYCLSACQSACTSYYEGSCSLDCTVSCESACQNSCEGICQFSCEMACQDGCIYACENSCQEFTCQAGGSEGGGACVTSCETGCEAYCESGFETGEDEFIPIQVISVSGTGSSMTASVKRIQFDSTEVFNYNQTGDEILDVLLFPASGWAKADDFCELVQGESGSWLIVPGRYGIALWG